MGLFNSTPQHTRFDSYVASNYDILAYTNDNDSAVKSVLGKFRNAMAIALNENDKLPKYILVVFDTDLMRSIDLENGKPGLSELYGRVLNYLFEEYHAAIISRKEQLPSKAKRYLYPQLFVTTVPQHKSFRDNLNRHRFNQCVEFLAGTHNEMKVLRMKRRWNYEDPTLVSAEGTLTEDGLLAYWASIDKALQFWETGKKKSYHNPSSSFVRKVRQNFEFDSKTSRGQHYDSRKYKWTRGEKMLP